MGFDLLNPWMLAGLAGVALPVLAHLLSRKRYDIVEWGAMQFLELDPNARRRLRLEDVVLLLVRMGLIALLAVALSRPWISGAGLGRFGSHPSRDLAVVLDGSDSMGWQSRDATPQHTARQAIQTIVDQLQPGDTVSLFDARDRTRLVIGPTRDFRKALQAVDDLPPSSGSSQLAAAVLQATQLLSRTTNLHREIIILADRQAKSWQADELTPWKRLDEMRSLSTVPVRIWAYDVSPVDFGAAPNISVNRLQLAREVTVPEVPLRVKTTIRRSGGQGAGPVKVYLSIDGVRLNDQTLQVRLPNQGEVNVEFEPRFSQPGSHLITISVDGDTLPADNQSDAVVMIRDGLPVLLIDGSPATDPVKEETFFAASALSSVGAERPWIRAIVQTVAETDFTKLADYSVIVLANVGMLTDAQAQHINQFVKLTGRSVLITAGDQVKPEVYDRWFDEGNGWLPCRFIAVAEDTAAELRGVRISNDGLEMPWLLPFRSEQGATLTEARFAKWWTVAWDAAAGDAADPKSRPVLAGRLNTGAPWLLVKKQGRGQVAVLTSTLDADWNTLPAKTDYVPWLHELLFFLSNVEASRNVEVGQPLVLNVSADLAVEEYTFRSPDGGQRPAERGGDDLQSLVRLSDPDQPGVYRFEPQTGPLPPGIKPEYFSVQADRSESDLTPLNDGQRAQLSAGNRLTFVKTLADLHTGIASDSSRAEIWWIVLYVFLAVLVCETWLTRRLVRGGQIVCDVSETPQPTPRRPKTANRSRKLRPTT